MRNLVSNKQAENDLAREVASHLTLLADDFERRGMPPEEARLAAKRAYGGVEQAKQAHRDERSLLWVEQTIQDLRYGLRTLSKSSGFTVTAVLTLALGIGASTAIFSVLYGVLIDPYPYRDANRIAMIYLNDKHGFNSTMRFLMADVQELRKARSVASAFAQQSVEMTSTDGDLPVTVQTVELSGNGFQFLDAPPILGRTFTAQEAPEGVAPPDVAVISYLFWKKHFAQAPNVLGKSLDLNHHRYIVIGVVGPRFTWGDGEVYLPLPAIAGPPRPLSTVIRLNPGVTVSQASAEISGLVRQLGHNHPDMLPPGSFDIEVKTINDGLLGEFKGTLLLLFAAVALLLLIGCVNVSILMLARGTSRQHELGLRAALGAGRLRIIRQLLTEATLLSVTGGVLGIGLAYLAIRLIVVILPDHSIPNEVVIRLNIPVLLFSAAVSIATGLAAGLAPALQFSNPRLNAILQSGDSRTTTSRRAKVRSAMMVGQIALTVLLLAGAGASMRTFLEAYTASLGFDPHNSLLILANFPEGAHTTWAARSQYVDALNEKIKATPGVTAAAEFYGGMPPMGVWNQSVDLPGAPPDASRRAGVLMVSADYFAVQRIPLLAGRVFTRAEVLRGSHLALVSEGFVKRYLSGANPIDRMVMPSDLRHTFPPAVAAPNPEQPYQVVGVVADVRNGGLHEPIEPQIYLPSTAVIFSGSSILVRTAGDPRLATHSIANAMRQVDQSQTANQTYAYEDFLSTFAWSHDRFISILFGIFSVVALGLAAIGLFSTVAYSVEQRTRDFGIRMALGATRGQVLRLTLASVAWTAGIGLLAGISLSIGLSDTFHKWTQSSMRDAGVLSLISAVFVLVSLLACYLPARRATQVDPAIALRSN
ncbi:ADOP family duplicated permease [Silvibacterium acidisoli]|uniref:ADOP family duplicated permease n=1 Tax=Acidobacteriaceae bacterium ZG23-2 TaxID=2883246 RepID=UPI00406C0F7C